MKMIESQSGVKGVTVDKSESILKTLLESSAEGIFIVNSDALIILANARALELFGYESEEILAHHIEILIPEQQREIHIAHRNKYLADPRNRPIGVGLDLSARKKDGSEFPAEISLSYAGKGADLMVMAIVNDISKRKELQKERSQLMEQRIAELETTLRTLEDIMRLPEASATTRAMGLMPLRESVPSEFRNLVDDYSIILDKSLEKRAFKIVGDISNNIEVISNRLGFMKATPRDVVDIHSEVLRSKGIEASNARMRGYIEEGHFLLLEIIGRLTTYYRNRAFGSGQERYRIELPKGG